MRIYFEEHQYQATDEVLRDLRDICALQDVEKKISVGYVGYFFNKEVGDCIFILPKVLLKDLKNDPKWGNVPDTIADIPPKKDGSPVMPEDIISPEGQEENLSMEYRKFIYEFAVYGYLKGEDPTGIDALPQDESEHGAWFNLSGQRVSNTSQPGVYVQKGTKVLKR